MPEMIGLRYLVKAAATKCGVALSERASVVVTRCPRDGRAAGKRLSKKEEKHANETQLEEWREKKEEKSPCESCTPTDLQTLARSHSDGDSDGEGE